MDRRAFKYVNWRKHTVGIILFAVALAVFSVSTYIYFDAKEQLLQSTNRLLQQKSTNDYTAQQLALFNEHYGEYQALQAGGLIGNKKRLQWLETLEAVGAHYKIPSVHFTLENARDAEDMTDHYWHPSLKLEKTSMELKLDLVHEGDWYNLLQHLHRHAKGVFSVERCLVQKKETDDYLLGMIGSCDLEWYTLFDVSDTWVAQ